jgi:hypothetical protein
MINSCNNAELGVLQLDDLTGPLWATRTPPWTIWLAALQRPLHLHLDIIRVSNLIDLLTDHLHTPIFISNRYSKTPKSKLLLSNREPQKIFPLARGFPPGGIFFLHSGRNSWKVAFYWKLFSRFCFFYIFFQFWGAPAPRWTFDLSSWNKLKLHVNLLFESNV